MNISITKENLRQALLEWETMARQGETLSPQETSVLSVKEVAEASAEYLWNILAKQTPVVRDDSERSGFDTLPDDYETGDY